MQSKFKRILFGGDYNPNQWPKEVWEQDMAYFKDAHINSATINVFSWAKIQPSENEYNFTELDEIVDMLSNETTTSSWQHPQQHCLHGWSRNILRR